MKNKHKTFYLKNILLKLGKCNYFLTFKRLANCINT